MSAVLQNPPRKRWTRDECDRLEALGMFDQQRVELIEGELIDKGRKQRPLVDAESLFRGWLILTFEARRVNHAAPIDVAPEDNSANQPEPDMIVLTREYAGSPRYLSTTPQPRDLDLVIEIADTSLAFDLTVKAALYARAGIVEYWVLDVLGRRLMVHRDPQDGQHGSVTAYHEQEHLALLSAPDSSFQVQTVFPE